MTVDRVMNSTQYYWIAKNLTFRFAEAFNNLINFNAPLNGRWIPFTNSLVLLKIPQKLYFLFSLTLSLLRRRKSKTGNSLILTYLIYLHPPRPTFTCTNSAVQTLEELVRYVQR